VVVGFSYYYGRVFNVNSGGLADVYVDVSYVGGFNIAPESTYGKGNYVAKLDVVVTTKGEQFTYFHTLYSTKKYDEPQLPELIIGEVAKGVVDIALDIASDHALEFVTSAAGKLFFKGLPYIGTVIECAEMFQSLGFDEVVASSEFGYLQQTGADGTGLVKSYDLWFVTEKREQKEPVVHYVIPTSTSLPNHLHYEGSVFRAQLCESIPVDLVKMQQFYVGEASFYTNDVSIDYYDGGSGRLYMVNNSLWFIPLLARDWGFPPKRGTLIFRLSSEERIVQQIPAQLIISWIRVGNPTAEKSLRDVGITEGALLNLEPVPVMEYSIPGYKIGEGVLTSSREPWVNGTKLAMYLVDNITRSTHNLGALLGDYKPIYTIWLSESRSLSADIMVYIIANATYMRAWRAVPPGYITASEEGAHAQESPLLPIVVLTGVLLSVATGLAIFLIKIRRGSYGDIDTL
jgi:hypothetical protein